MVIAVLAVLAAGGAFAAGLYRHTPMLRIRRALRRVMGDIDRELDASDEVLRAPMTALRTSASAFADEQVRRRRRDVDLEGLKEAGAKNVQWSALRDAGLATLQDVYEKSEAALIDLPGVGPTSAKRVVDAAAILNRKITSEPTELPKPDLPDRSAEHVAARALDALFARDALGGIPRELVRLRKRLQGEVGQIDAHRSFWRWLFGRRSMGHLVPAYQEAFAARRRVVAELEGGLVEDLRARREQIPGLPAIDIDRVDIRSRFRSRYADACALIDSVLPGRSTGADATSHAEVHPLASRLPLEIAQAVAAFPLSVDGLDVTLRRYQAFGAKYLLHQRRTILGDEMGLGKTIEALAAIVHRNEVDGSKHFLVVAPASVVRNWMREIETRTDLSGHLLAGSGRAEATEAWIRDGGIAVVSYATLRAAELDRHIRGAGMRVGFLIADEAHYAKNPAAGRSRALQGVIEHAEHVCLMSGTPLENHPDEFCNLVSLVAPAVSANLRQGGAIIEQVVVEPARFHATVAPVYLRRNQEDVLRELPPKVEFEDWVEMKRDERADYRAAVTSRNMMAMRRSVTVSTRGGTSAKMARLSEILEEHRESGRKVLVFSFFLDVIDEVAARFETLGTITGDAPSDRRMDLVDRFQQADGHALLVCQIQAGGIGINLHAASVVVLMEPQWKPSTEEQAIARAHRMGQTETVLVHRLLTRDSVDERLVEILDGKLQLFQAYAKESLIKKVSREATEAAMSDLVLAYELERLRDAG